MRKSSLLIAALVLAILMVGSMALAQEGQPDTSKAATGAVEVGISPEPPADTATPSGSATTGGTEQTPATADDQAQQPAAETDPGGEVEQPAEASGDETSQGETPGEAEPTGDTTSQGETPGEAEPTGDTTSQSETPGEAEPSGDTTSQSETPGEAEPTGDTTSQSETPGEAEPSGDDAPAKEEEVAEEKPVDPKAPYLSVTFAEGEKPRIIMETTMGKMVIELWPDLAPKHCQSFVYLTEKGFFDSLTFHRIVPRFVIQGGCPEGTGMGGPGYSVPAEFSKTLHEDGILSMARSSDPNSAGSQFFICLGRLTSLDDKYTVFGKVVEGLEVAHEIEAVPTAREKPKTPVVMTKVFVEKSD